MIDPRTGTSTVHYGASGEIDYTEGAAGYRTTYAYDAASRQIAITDPNTNTVERHYSPRGELLSEWNATYPVRHEFDGYGQHSDSQSRRKDSFISLISDRFRPVSSPEHFRISFP